MKTLHKTIKCYRFDSYEAVAKEIRDLNKAGECGEWFVYPYWSAKPTAVDGVTASGAKTIEEEEFTKREEVSDYRAYFVHDNDYNVSVIEPIEAYALEDIFLCETTYTND